MTTPVSRMADAATTSTQSDSSATVYRATRSAASASPGPVTIHWTNATAGDGEEDGHGGPAAEDKREDQGRDEPQVGTARGLSQSPSPSTGRTGRRRARCRRRWRSGGRRHAAVPRPAMPHRADGRATPRSSIPSVAWQASVRSQAGAIPGTGDVSWGPSDPSFPGGTTMVVPLELGLRSATTGVPRPQPSRRRPAVGSSRRMKLGRDDHSCGRLVRAGPVLRSKGQESSGGARKRACSAPSTQRSSHRPWMACCRPTSPPVRPLGAAPPPPGTPRGRRRPAPRPRG